ncbi:hypothetical protein Aph02nite_87480 [Actinoplanes philippinensis]|uniref:Uncharacterized protein n=1 Tax=Actinoplanes philippinensis TaxID=35752 RepID=A0A1I2MJY5_9ACTN|nr:hypothetical protein [Actinoplanes philippinensis]GIE82798.1 hypothetical protein Aph02nite_87480 [Actinoplanes philippinensis]SFF91029.1 hypothetical protein SAMN05421541_1307 [Actinoplanes philippinensis]
MAARAYPYRTAPEHVNAAQWMSVEDGTPIGEYLPSWDYGSVVRLQRSIEVDMLALLGECGLTAGARLGINVRYWPGTSLLRQTVLHVVLGVPEATSGRSSNVLDIEIPGADLAAVLTVETTLVLLEDPSGNDEAFVARRAGSILWRDEASVRLEGTAGLLPVAPVSFKEQGLPTDAAWYVSVDSSEWTSAAMGNLLVLLNDDNPAVRKAITAPDQPDSAVLLDALTVDVVCDLVGRALLDEEFPVIAPAGEKLSEPSMAALVRSFIVSFLSLPTEGLETAFNRLRDEWQRDPSRLRARAQSSLRFPGSRGS